MYNTHSQIHVQKQRRRKAHSNWLTDQTQEQQNQMLVLTPCLRSELTKNISQWWYFFRFKYLLRLFGNETVTVMSVSNKNVTTSPDIKQMFLPASSECLNVATSIKFFFVTRVQLNCAETLLLLKKSLILVKRQFLLIKSNLLWKKATKNEK